MHTKHKYILEICRMHLPPQLDTNSLGLAARIQSKCSLTVSYTVDTTVTHIHRPNSPLHCHLPLHFPGAHVLTAPHPP
jgi:hypothetical protein